MEKKAKGTPFFKELLNGRSINVNGNPMPMAYYNLVLSIRDLKLWKAGMKPHRFWKVTDVKNYFGLKGHDRQELVNQLDAIREYVDELIEEARRVEV